MLGLLDELDAPEAKSSPIIVNCDLANAIELRLTQHLPAIVPIEIARIFLRRTFWVTQTTIWRHQQLSPRASSTGDGVRLAESQRTRRTRVPSCLQCDETRARHGVRESLLERIWSVEDQDLFMVFEIQLAEGCRHSVMDSSGCERSRCCFITVQRSHYGTGSIDSP